MRILQLVLVSFIAIMIVACGKSVPEMNDLDMVAWRADANACSGDRTRMLKPMQSQKDSLLRLDEAAVVKLLGRPDENELYTRNQKFYRYYLTAARSCGNPDSTSVMLIIRFTAMGVAKEITIE